MGLKMWRSKGIEMDGRKRRITQGIYDYDEIRNDYKAYSHYYLS